MESFWSAVQVVAPMTLLMALGALSRGTGLVDRSAMRQVDRLVFRIFMPSLLFVNIYGMKSSGTLGWRELGFTVAGLGTTFLMALVLPPRLVRDGNKAASIAQALVRPNYLLFGTAVSEGLYGQGNVGAVALLGVLIIPSINALAAVVLELNRSGRAKLGRLLLAILKNPMIMAALAAFGLRAFSVPIPAPVWSVLRSLAASTTTISFISLGVGLDLGEARSDLRPLAIGVLLRMVLVPLIFLPLSAALGFGGPILCALMVFFSAPAAVASYPMAVAMGADGQLAGQLVCVTTLLSVFSIFLCTLLFRGLGLL